MCFVILDGTEFQMKELEGRWGIEATLFQDAEREENSLFGTGTCRGWEMRDVAVSLSLEKTEKILETAMGAQDFQNACGIIVPCGC